MIFHKMSEPEARTTVGMRTATIPIILPGQEITHRQVRVQKPDLSCSICSKTYSRREYVTSHLVSAHGKSVEEAKEMTGFETKRDLPSLNTSGQKKKTGLRTGSQPKPNPNPNPDSVSNSMDSDGVHYFDPSRILISDGARPNPNYNQDFISSVPVSSAQEALSSQSLSQWQVLSTTSYPHGFHLA